MRLKHLFRRLLAMVLALAILPLSLAMAAAPGETVYIPIPYYVNGIIALTRVRVTFSLTDGLSYGGANGGNHQVMLPVSPPSPQGVVYLPVTVNANAPGMGDQMVDITQVVGGDDSGLDTAGNPATHTIQVTNHVHSYGPWVVVNPPSYEATGLERRVCIHDESHVETRVIPKKAIIWGDWQVVRQATCTQEGLEERVALGDASLKETRALPMLPHQEATAWIVTKLPTFEAKGLKILQCKVGGETLITMTIPAQAVPAWTRSPLDAAGPGGSKGPVSISLAKEGSKVIRLVDQAGTIMGKLVVMVQNGQVTFNYEIFPPFTATGGNVSLSDPQRGAMVLPFNETFSIPRDLGGKTRFDVYVSLEAENPEALAKLTSPNPLVMPNVPMQTIDISTAMGSASMTTVSGSDVNNMNKDELMALLPLIEKTAEGQNDAAAQAKVQDMMAKAQNLLTQADSMSEAARKRSIDAILNAAIQMMASIPQSTGTGSEQVNKAGQDANTPTWNIKDLMQTQINLEEEGTEDSKAKVDEMIKEIIKNLNELTNTLRVWENTLK